MCVCIARSGCGCGLVVELGGLQACCFVVGGVVVCVLIELCVPMCVCLLCEEMCV